jgi:hypothetical protein
MFLYSYRSDVWIAVQNPRSMTHSLISHWTYQKSFSYLRRRRILKNPHHLAIYLVRKQFLGHLYYWNVKFIIPRFKVKNDVFWVLTRATRRNNPEDAVLHSHSHENLKSKVLTVVIAMKMPIVRVVALSVHWQSVAFQRNALPPSSCSRISQVHPLTLKIVVTHSSEMSLSGQHGMVSQKTDLFSMLFDFAQALPPPPKNKF